MHLQKHGMRHDTACDTKHALAETWLVEHIFDNEILPSNYTFFAKIVHLVVEEYWLLWVISSLIKLTSPENVEIICIKLMLSSPITYVLLMYLPALLLSIMMVYSAFSYICIMFLIKGLYSVTSTSLIQIGIHCWATLQCQINFVT